MKFSYENLDQFILEEKHINQLSVFAEGNSYLVFQSIDITHHGYVFRIKKDGKCNEQKTDKLHYSADATARSWIPLTYQIKSSKLLLCPKFITLYNQSSFLTRSSTITSTAYIERNLSYLLTTSATSVSPDQKSSRISSSDTLSFEFKVKCGFVSMVPTALLSSIGEKNRLIKHQYGRFTLLQYSKLYETLYKSKSPRWGELQYSNNIHTDNTYNISLYNPLDLFSYDITRIQSAIHHLLAYPQNNLKLLYNGNHIYGWNKYNIKHAYTAFDHFIGLAHEKGHNSYLSVIQMISTILVNEELLSYICCLQALDVLDVEGMGCIYEHLTSLLHTPTTATPVAITNSDIAIHSLTSPLVSDSVTNPTSHTTDTATTDTVNPTHVPTNSNTSATPPAVMIQTVEEMLYDYIHLHPTLPPALMPLLKVIAGYKLLYSDYINNNSNTYSINSDTEGSSSNSACKQHDNGIMDWSTYYDVHKGHNSDPTLTVTSEDDKHKISILLQMMSYTTSPPTICTRESSAPIEDYTDNSYQPLNLNMSLYEWVSQLSIQDCLFILHCWLVSLCAKDISVVLTMSKGDITTITSSTDTDTPSMHTLPTTAYGGSSHTTSPTDLSEPNPLICHIQAQTEDNHGVVRCFQPATLATSYSDNIINSSGAVWQSTQHITPVRQERQYYDVQYRMTSIDLDGKPVTKLSQKLLEESAICAQAKYMIDKLRRNIHS